MKIKDRLAKLIDVKSIITLFLTLIFGYAIINKLELPEFFKTIYTSVINFYFCSQVIKNSKEDNDKNDKGNKKT